MTTRRTFLRSAVVAGAAAAAPVFWTRRAHGQTDAFGAADHVIVLFAQGGLRSHCLFNAVGTTQHNPYGVAAGAASSEWTLGGAAPAEDIVTAAHGTVPGFHRIANDVAVVACVDHEPNGRPVVDHDPAIVQLGTGVPAGTDGLLARLLTAHPRYASGIGAEIERMPPVDIGSTPFGRSGSERVPLRVPTLAGTGVPAIRRAVARSWATDARDVLDERFARRVPAAFTSRVSILARSKVDGFAFARLLVDPRLDVVGSPDVVDAGVSNAELLDVLGTSDLQERGDSASNPPFGPDVALAVRWLAFGAPMVALRRDLFDTHSRERTTLPVRAADLLRQLAGLRHLLAKMPHPRGGTYFDRTVVVVVSEFGRNNTLVDTGYNSGFGSDHVVANAAPTRNQAVAFLGGPVSRLAGGKLVGSTDGELQPTGPVFSMRSVHSTLLDLLGAPHASFWPDAPIAALTGGAS